MQPGAIFAAPMRVIAGKFRSLPIVAPKGWKTRPTSDRLRETLFNVLAPRIQGAIFADLFAGTGAVGIEALSRGAAQVYFAEQEASALAALQANLKKVKAGAEALVEPGGTQSLLRRFVHQGTLLDIVFLDPPYSDRPAYQATLDALSRHPILSRDAIVIVEHSRRHTVADIIARHFHPDRVLEQGEAALTFCRRLEQETCDR